MTTRYIFKEELGFSLAYERMKSIGCEVLEATLFLFDTNMVLSYLGRHSYRHMWE